MQHVGAVVEHAAHAVAAEVAHHRTAMGLDIALDGVADVAQGRAGLDHRQAARQALIGDVHQSPRPGWHLADAVHAAGVAVPAVDDHGDVDVDDVALAQRLVAGDAVADHMVGRDADRLGVAAIAQAGRQGAVIEDELARQVVQAFGRHAGLDVGDQHIQAFGRQPAGDAHAFEVFGGVNLDAAGADGHVGDGVEGHAAGLSSVRSVRRNGRCAGRTTLRSMSSA